MSAKNRAKGLDFERKVANAFRLAGWLGAKRHLEFQQAEAQGFDLDGTEPFRIQCKRLAAYAPVATMGEIKPAPGVVPLLVTKPDDGPAMVVLRFTDFIALAAKLKRAGVKLASPTVDDF